jgi:hypothetical protein
MDAVLEPSRRQLVEARRLIVSGAIWRMPRQSRDAVLLAIVAAAEAALALLAPAGNALAACELQRRLLEERLAALDVGPMVPPV